MRLSERDADATLDRLVARAGWEAADAPGAAPEADPYPDGALAAIRALRGSSATIAGPRLATGGLATIDGGLPEYLYEAMLAAVHAGDRGLYDFLSTLDARFLELRARTAAATRLVDGIAGGRGLLSALAGLACPDAGPEIDLAALLPLLDSSRSLGGLSRLMRLESGLQATVEAAIDHRSPIDPTARSRLGRRRGQNAALGAGAIAGGTGPGNEARLSVWLTAAGTADLDRVRVAAPRLLAIARLYLRDPADLSLGVRIARRYLAPPRLSARRMRAARLDGTACLAPHLRPDRTTRVRLDRHSPVSARRPV